MASPNPSAASLIGDRCHSDCSNASRACVVNVANKSAAVPSLAKGNATKSAAAESNRNREREKKEKKRAKEKKKAAKEARKAKKAKRKEKKQQAQQREEFYPCSGCAKRFRHEDALERHLWSAHEDEQYAEPTGALARSS